MESQFQAEETAVTPTVENPTAISSLESETEVVPQDEAVVQAWLEKAHREIHKRKKSFIFRLVLLALSFTLLMVPVRFLNPPLVLFPLFFVLSMVAGHVAVLRFVFVGDRQPLPINIEDLVRLGGIRAIGPLVDALRIITGHKHRKALYAALTALLPRLKATDTHLLTPVQRRALANLLRQASVTVGKYQEGHDFILALLKALEQVGDKTFLPAVEQLASRKSRTEKEAQIQEAAEACLPYLRERVGLAPLQQTLLRASSAEHSTPETLLRPAAPSLETPAEQLLRPTEEGGR